MHQTVVLNSTKETRAMHSAQGSENPGRSVADPEFRHQMIQVAAYYRAEKRGFDGHNPGVDWFEVDQLLKRSSGLHAYVEGVEDLLARWDAQFQDIRNKVSKKKADVKVEYEAQLHSLEDKRTVINDALRELRQCSGAAWDDMKGNIDTIWDGRQSGFHQC